MSATTVLPFAPRHVTTDLGDSLRITLPNRKNWLAILPAAFFVAVWSAVEVVAIGFITRGLLNLINSQPLPALLAQVGFPGVFVVLWFSLWTFGGLTAAYTLLWSFAGREVIDVNPLSIRLSQRVPGWGRSREYLAEHIKNLRVSGQFLPEWHMRRSAWPAATAGQLAFDYGARTIRFADADEAEAKMILAEIQQRFPQYRGKISPS